MKYENSALQYALRYTQSGLTIIPTETSTHREYVAKYQFRPTVNWQSLRPTSDSATIARHFLRAPYAGIGLALQSSGILAVIANGIEGSSTLETWMDEHDDWRPWDTASFEGGEARTLLYRAGGLRVDSEVQLGPGVTVQGTGYVPLPPSHDDAGVFHQWDDDSDLTISALSQWLLEKLSGPVEVAA